MASRKQERNEETRRAIIREWDAWAPGNDTRAVSKGLEFFAHLQKEKPHLLEFSYPGDKWQAVHGWLLHARRVQE
jgi:hypothetical protein